ncbi:hypothetical protein PMPD1_3087 [Paramixta manurensis]|uniref:Uncharacterized protein n=1 Tax=Paramixta manurensis TaxID=2740817 RepID=A0A6M8UJQ2_9GAMM|nr:hypothetical protein PMPD1_3087 [Erwiniaceae bacterium PD-1]
MLFRNILIKYYSPEDVGGAPPAAAEQQPGNEPPSGQQPTTPPVQPSTLDGGGEQPPASPQKFPDNWRDEFAGDDAKYRKQLERYASPAALAKAYRELQSKVSSGELKNNKLPDKPTDEELSTWRKENGVPEKADDYINDLPSGVVLGEDDKPRVKSFLDAMHAENAPKGLVQKAIEWNQKQIEEDAQQRYEANANLREQTEESLRAEWGGEYKRNINLVNGLIATLPDEARDAFANATTADGTAIFNNPDVVRWMVDMARKVNPVGTVVPGATNISAVDTEIESIEKVMRENRSAYNKDTKMQERYLQLLEAKERLQLLEEKERFSA